MTCKRSAPELGNGGTFMTSKMRTVLLSSAASMIVVTGAVKGVQAADMPVVKANPVDYVERCTQYGNGWIRYPGTAYCIKLASKVSFDIDTADRREFLVLQQDGNGKSTHFSQTLVPKAQQDAWGLGTNVSFG